MKLAICEDNPTHYEMINTLLQKSLQISFDVTHFTSGDEFLRAIADGMAVRILLS